LTPIEREDQRFGREGERIKWGAIGYKGAVRNNGGKGKKKEEEEDGKGGVKGEIQWFGKEGEERLSALRRKILYTGLPTKSPPVGRHTKCFLPIGPTNSFIRPRVTYL
jgi:hypothetical protein